MLKKFPIWISSCIIGMIVGAISFFLFIVLFSFTPLYFLLAVFGAWGSSPVDVFFSLAPLATWVGAWTGGLIGMLVGSFMKQDADRKKYPGWLNGLIFVVFFFNVSFFDSSSSVHEHSLTLKIITFILFTSFGALIGFIFTVIKKFFKSSKKTIPPAIPPQT